MKTLVSLQDPFSSKYNFLLLKCFLGLSGCLYGEQYIGKTIYCLFALSTKISPTYLYETDNISLNR